MSGTSSDWLASREACALVGITRQSLTEAANKGAIDCLRNGRTVLYYRPSLLTYMAKRERRAAAAAVCSVEPTDPQPKDANQ